MRVTVRLPLTGVWVATIRVPDEAIDNIAGFLEDNPEYLEDIESNGQLTEEVMSLLDAQIEAE